MSHLYFQIIDKKKQDINGKKLKYVGYKLECAGEISYDSKDTSKCYVPAHKILETLKEEINIKCSFIGFIGSLRLIADDWMGRIDKNFKQAKKNRKNQVCFDNKELESKVIVMKSLSQIDVCAFI